ncbi:hypothetical protein EVAR_14581_1 [Eumeta japonica]|uniref:Uncharacterized protein n=1 Tax=Eumeta variegata TaxID=151549 RepID=A0A4C1UW87_EUMVA|nr:hypothetical protein EVAR_14581_1 [Eumeta japonica]
MHLPESVFTHQFSVQLAGLIFITRLCYLRANGGRVLKFAPTLKRSVIYGVIENLYPSLRVRVLLAGTNFANIELIRANEIANHERVHRRPCTPASQRSRQCVAGLSDRNSMFNGKTIDGKEWKMEGRSNSQPWRKYIENFQESIDTFRAGSVRHFPTSRPPAPTPRRIPLHPPVSTLIYLSL